MASEGGVKTDSPQDAAFCPLTHSRYSNRGEGCWEAQNIRLAWPADLRVTHYPGRSSQRPTTAFAASLSVRVAALFAHPVVGLVAVGVHAKGVWRGRVARCTVESRRVCR